MKRLCILLALWAVCRPVVPVLAGDDLPYETGTGTEAGVLAGAAAVWGFGYWLDRGYPGNRPFLAEEAAALDPGHLPSFDQGATRRWSPAADRLSDRFLMGSLVAPLVLGMTDVGSREPLTLTVMHLEALLLNGGATYLLKNRTRRARPFVYNRDHRIPESLRLSRTARRSFPSGHTSTAFTSLVFLATVYGKMYPESESRYWVWAGCLATATTTGYLRYRAGYHFPSDIWAGAALGGFVGWLIPQWHEVDRALPRGGEKSRPVLVGVTLGF